MTLSASYLLQLSLSEPLFPHIDRELDPVTADTESPLSRALGLGQMVDGHGQVEKVQMELGCNLVTKHLGSMWETLGSDHQCWENRNTSNVRQTT